MTSEVLSGQTTARAGAPSAGHVPGTPCDYGTNNSAYTASRGSNQAPGCLAPVGASRFGPQTGHATQIPLSMPLYRG